MRKTIFSFKNGIGLLQLGGCFCMYLFYATVYCQQENSPSDFQYILIPELQLGKTMEANTGFPESKLQKGVLLSLGTTSNAYKEWSRRLGVPRVGLTMGAFDFGNIDKIGYAYTLMPFIEFSLLKTQNLFHVQIGMGGAYIDTKFNPETNPFNLAVTTDVNWSFRSFLYYNIYSTKLTDWRLGIGYTHFSNGHTRLPNQGLNSFLFSLSSSIYNKRIKKENLNIIDNKNQPSSSVETFFETRFGLGQNVLSRVYNTKKEVFSTAISAGRIIKSTYKFSFGAYYRFYEQYYDHIRYEERLVNEQVPEFKDDPYRYATNFGLFIGAELLIGHFGAEFNIGANIYKPFYAIDWQLSQGFFANGDYVKLGELDSYYKLKKIVSSRLGMRYYLMNTANHPVNNFFIAAHINANLGQADFSELSLGYIHQLRYSKKR